jgi:hypothetical protein
VVEVKLKITTKTLAISAVWHFEAHPFQVSNNINALPYKHAIPVKWHLWRVMGSFVVMDFLIVQIYKSFLRGGFVFLKLPATAVAIYFSIIKV